MKINIVKTLMSTVWKLPSNNMGKKKIPFTTLSQKEMYNKIIHLFNELVKPELGNKLYKYNYYIDNMVYEVKGNGDDSIFYPIACNILYDNEEEVNKRGEDYIPIEDYKEDGNICIVNEIKDELWCDQIDSHNNYVKYRKKQKLIKYYKHLCNKLGKNETVDIIIKHLVNTEDTEFLYYIISKYTDNQRKKVDLFEQILNVLAYMKNKEDGLITKLKIHNLYPGDPIKISK